MRGHVRSLNNFKHSKPLSNTYTNILSEEYLLGALLLDPESVIMTLRGDGIDQASFTTKDNQRIWTMANRLDDDGRIHSIEVMDIEQA